MKKYLLLCIIWFSQLFASNTCSEGITVNMYDESLYADGNTIFGSADGTCSAIIDKEGNVIWNSGVDNIIYYNLLDDGGFYGAQYDGALEYPYQGVKFSLIEPEGAEIVWEEPNEESVHHEFIELPWGDYMGIVNLYQDGPVYPNPYDDEYIEAGCTPDGVTICWPWRGDKLVIWDKENPNQVKWSWSVFDHYNMIDFDNNEWNQIPYDFQTYENLPFNWTHVNAFYFDERDNTILISSRNLSRITKIQIQENNGVITGGDIIWNMGRESASGDVTFGHDLDFSWQHSISLTDEDNILIFDNGNYAVEYWGAEIPTSRALAIAVSGSTGDYSASIAFEYILPDELFGSTSGNVQQLQNGNYLITTIGNQGTSLEVTSDSTLVWQANYSSYAMWRASRIPQCPALLGDLNGDGGFNVLDVVILSNCILAQNCGQGATAWSGSDCGEAVACYGCAGDVNGDTGFNVLDVVILSNCILAQNCGD